MESSAGFTQQIAHRTQPSENLFFLFHLAVPHPTLKRLIPGLSQIMCGEVCDILDNTRLVIGSTSGALLEATVLGIPALVTREPGNVHFAYVPDVG